jgi:cardiolipin synthase
MRRVDSGLKRFAETLLFCLFLFSCQTLPDIRTLSRTYPYDGSPPLILSSTGPLSRQDGEAIYNRLLPEAAGSALLGRHTAFIQDLTGSPLICGNNVKLLHDGPETFTCMADAIRGAKDHVNIETFIFRDDPAGRFFSDLLIEKSGQGVEVNLIYDGFGNRRTPAVFYETMRAFGVRAIEYNPFTLKEALGKGSINNRDHRKILVIDGKVAFTGGINFYWEQTERIGPSGKPEIQPWRDTHIRIEGPAVREFQRIFLETWKEKGGDQGSPDRYFPPQEEKGDLLVQVIADGPGQRFPNIYAVYISAFVSARKSIHLTHSYVFPPKDMLAALEAAATEGIDVKLIVPGFSDFWLPFHAGRSNYRRLLKAGVRIYEFQNALLHSKKAVVDGVWSTIGSTNLIPRSFVQDLEISTVILGPVFGAEMEKTFHADLAKSREIRLEEWDRRSLKGRFLEIVAQLFSYWL